MASLIGAHLTGVAALRVCMRFHRVICVTVLALMCVPVTALVPPLCRIVLMRRRTSVGLTADFANRLCSASRRTADVRRFLFHSRAHSALLPVICLVMLPIAKGVRRLRQQGNLINQLTACIEKLTAVITLLIFRPAPLLASRRLCRNRGFACMRTSGLCQCCCPASIIHCLVIIARIALNRQVCPLDHDFRVAGQRPRHTDFAVPCPLQSDIVATVSLHDRASCNIECLFFFHVHTAALSRRVSGNGAAGHVEGAIPRAIVRHIHTAAAARFICIVAAAADGTAAHVERAALDTHASAARVISIIRRSVFRDLCTASGHSERRVLGNIYTTAKFSRIPRNRAAGHLEMCAAADIHTSSRSTIRTTRTVAADGAAGHREIRTVANTHTTARDVVFNGAAGHLNTPFTAGIDCQPAIVAANGAVKHTEVADGCKIIIFDFTIRHSHTCAVSGNFTATQIQRSHPQNADTVTFHSFLVLNAARTRRAVTYP